MAGAAQPIIRITTPSRTFEGHESKILAVAVFPDRRRMVTGSGDKMLHLWDLEDGVVLKKMEGHREEVRAVAVSKDGQLIASGDNNGELIAWNRDGESLTQPIKVHSKKIMSLDFSPDGAVLASGSWDRTTELWSTNTWQVQGNPINCGEDINCVRYSPSGEHLAIATDGNIQIWNAGTRERIVNFRGHAGANNYSLAWTPDGTRLLSGGSNRDHTIREWDASSWKQVGDPWKGHTHAIHGVAMNFSGTLLASASDDGHVRLWRLSDRRTVAIFKHSYNVCRVTFSMDGKYILSGGKDPKVLKWVVPDDALLEVIPNEQASEVALPEEASKEQVTNNSTFAAHSSSCTSNVNLDAKAQESDFEILAIDTTARNACIAGDLPTAEDMLTQDINIDGNDYNAYANRSFVRARKLEWDPALHDALKSISIQPSLIGCLSKGIALCGKGQFQDAMKAFDLAFMFVDGDSNITHLLLLIKAIALFNANQHDEAILRVKELAATFPNADTLACVIVETYLHVQMGIDALDDVPRNDEAADHFSAAVTNINFSSTAAMHSKYEIFVVLFGWNLKSLWQTAHQNWCHALLRAAFKNECSALYAAHGVIDLAAKGDTALAAGNYDRAIELYSVAVDLDLATDTIFANRCKAKLGKILWDDALLDAQKVIKLTPLSYHGYQLKHAALHGAKHYDEAIEAFQIMLSKLENTPDTQIQKLRRQYVSRPEAEFAIEETIKTQFDNAPHRLLNTFTGRLCDREAQINAFRTSTEYKELLSSTVTHADLQTSCIQDVVATYFRYVMLSHRWEGKEPLLRDIQDEVVYELDPVGGIAKLQSFCKTARDAGYRWAWVDTCCIDQSNNVEVQLSVNSMFVWYRHSALTIVYLSDVPPLSRSGALASSAWNTRGWTIQEFLAPNIILFYQNDWTLYLGDCSLNHKHSVVIMKELGDATGIDAQALVAFRPGMRGAREKLQWVSTRVTTWPEDIAYSLFGIFGVNLTVIYGEKKQKALGRLLQEVVAQSGDISALDWVGQSSEFNSCLPADIISYKTLPSTPPSLSEDVIQTSVSSLRDATTVELASKLYTLLDNVTAPRFANCRLHLPCIVFRVTGVRRSRAQDQETHVTYEVKAGGLHDLLITTKDKLIQFSLARPTMQTFLLVRPWNRHLLGLPDFTELPDIADDMESEEDHWLVPGSPEECQPVDLGSSDRSLRFIVRLGQPFSAFLLAQQRGGEYKRIASDHDIIAEVKDVASIQDMMDIRTLEIL
ncbi:hypothetical protein DFH29DRAFT_1005099 [Suillus ampliporus]|nr:hypothetical protein DFH29DRAFT_1005099 [Suillus ampliporus]